MVASVLQALGLICVTIGAAMLAVPAGFVVGGFALVVVGLAVES